ncbi:MAG: preprotein translocase subunit YajC [Parachlamydiales bacterium]|nr:preprotein translocase subunit YajC [Parachlamydiales bacterium]
MKKIFKFLLFVPVLLSAQDTEVTEAVQPAKGNYMQPIIMIVLILLFSYFLLWRPEQRRRKAAEAQRSSLKKGDRVTAMGILGTIDQVKDTTIILKTYDGSKIEFLKAAVTNVESASVVEEKNEQK